ncbi:MAG: hypothetical protein ACUVT0_03795 [Thermochromatium sp.]
MSGSGLQRLGTPPFGTPQGRLVLRHLILLRPFLSGALLMLPVIGLVSLMGGGLIDLNLSLAALTLVLGVLPQYTRRTASRSRQRQSPVSAPAQPDPLVIGLI